MNGRARDATPVSLSHGHALDSGLSLRERQKVALADADLQRKVARGVDQFRGRREHALAQLDDSTALRDAARAMRVRGTTMLPELLDTFADNVLRAGGNVCWATDADEANRYILDVVRRVGGSVVAKGKSMATEEIGLNHALEGAGIEVVETDLGEWIIQLNDETPSHIIAPALHLDRYDIKHIFDEKAQAGGIDAVPETMNAFAREKLRDVFLSADVGITGCNLAIAETGSILLVENEGNGRMCSTVPRVHIAVMGMERIVATWDQADVVVNLLARSATGQPLSVYTNILTGPRHGDETDGPDELHVVILDNGRSQLLGTDMAEMLSCIRCGACLNVCPVYRQTAGHAYGWVYSGPMGAVLTPLLAEGHGDAADLPNASTLCGACADACPVGIPLQDLLLGLRRRRSEHASRGEQAQWRAWASAWKRASTYEASLRAASLSRFAGPLRRFLPGARQWKRGGRDVPALVRPGDSFRTRWKNGEI